MAEPKTVTAIALASPPAKGMDLFRVSTDAASICREIVLAASVNIQGKKYCKVEAWQAIAIAHGCFAGAGDVERIYDPEGGSGYRAIGRVIRGSDGQVLSTAEGFVGDDEKAWGKRDVYARRAMAQTRAISRACRSAFAHVVIMMNAGLETTPAEEVPREGFDAAPEGGNLEEKLKASVDMLAKKKAQANAAAASQVLEGEIVDAEDIKEFTMPFASKQGKWEKGAPISSLETADIKGLAKWKGARDDLKQACADELAARGE